MDTFSTNLDDLLGKKEDYPANQEGAKIHPAVRQSESRNNDSQQQMAEMHYERETVPVPRVPAALPPATRPTEGLPSKTEGFLNYLPFLSAFNISEGDLKNMLVGVVLLMVLQMPQFKSSLLGVVPQILKSNSHISNLTSAVAIVLLYVIIQKLMT